MLTEHSLIEFHEQSWRNRAQVGRAAICGCFYCLKEFNPAQILKWTDDGETALCPICDIDSVIGFEAPPIDQALLRAMHERWFERIIRQ